MTGGLPPKLVRLRAIGEALLDSARRAFAVNVPSHGSPPSTRNAQVETAGRDPDERVGDLELESATRVKC